jgi:hypothetical protein
MLGRTDSRLCRPMLIGVARVSIDATVAESALH